MSNKYCQALAELRNKPAHELKEVGDQWRTPDNIFWGINTLFGPFVLDLFTDGDNAKCAAYYTAEDNALAHDWSERLAELKGAAFGTRMVPQASAWAINRVAQKAVSVATRQVAGNTVAGDNQVKGIPLKLVRQRVRVFKASPSGKMTARIRVNRGNLPAIKLGTARVRLARRGGKLQYRGSVLKVGKYLFRDAFIQQLANGRWHVMRRIDGKNRYPIDVVKIPLSGPLTQAFEDARDRIIAAEMPKQLGYALKQQLRLWLTR